MTTRAPIPPPPLKKPTNDRLRELRRDAPTKEWRAIIDELLEWRIAG